MWNKKKKESYTHTYIYIERKTFVRIMSLGDGLAISGKAKKMLLKRRAE